jgi:hypothetical protein
MEYREIILGSFITKKFLTKAQYILYKKHKIYKSKIFVYEIEGESDKYFITYKVKFNTTESFLDIKNTLRNTLHLNKKGASYFTINGLNKLIEIENTDISGNIDYKIINVDWEQHQNKLIYSNNDSLIIKEIKKIELF